MNNKLNLFLSLAGVTMLVVGAFMWGQKSQNQTENVAQGELAQPEENQTETTKATVSANLTESDDLQLQVPLDQTEAERATVMSKIKENGTFFLRDIYEEHIDSVGANGLINAVQTAYPKCHDRGHDLGKVIYSRIQSIGPSLRTCQDACYSGCMHGVLMEAFDEETPESHEHPEEELGFHLHVAFEDIKAKVGNLCSDENLRGDYKEGDCLHGVGHALMSIADYDITTGVGYCDIFEEENRRYYCATGAYMEYNNNFGESDYKEKSLFYPCDQSPYPAACFRYKLVAVFALHYREGKAGQELIQQCLAIKDENVRIGCMHGVGNANMSYVAAEKVNFETLCGFGNRDDQYVCIEGVIERMTKYHPGEAQKACNSLTTLWKKNLCTQGLENGIYNLDKSFDLYRK